MAERTEALRDGLVLRASAVPAPRGGSRARRREAGLAYAILTPTLLVVVCLVAYPFVAGIVLSFQNKMVGAPARFVGLANYLELFRDEVFPRTAWNSVVSPAARGRASRTPTGTGTSTTAAWGPVILGYSHPALVAAAHRAAERPFTYGAQHELEISVAERIQAAVPSAERVAFSSSGSEVVQLAHRLARAFTRRTLMLKFEATTTAGSTARW